ncbi:MAG: PH domain-containing protein [Prevotella sp.]|jgi:hypothetical protein
MEQRREFETSVGWWYWAVIIILLVITLYLSYRNDNLVVSIIFWMLLGYVSMLPSLVCYIVNGDTLTVVKGIFLMTNIPISAIKSINATRNPISSPALSMHRLSIKYNKYDKILVSPKDRKGFIDALKAVNPDIKIEI